MVTVEVRVYKCAHCGRECYIRARAYPYTNDELEPLFNKYVKLNDSCIIFGGSSRFEFMYSETEDIKEEYVEIH